MGLEVPSRKYGHECIKAVISTGVATKMRKIKRPGAYKSSIIGLKKRQNAPFSFFVFKIFVASQNIVSNSGRVHDLDTLLSHFSLQVEKSYQIASKCTI